MLDVCVVHVTPSELVWIRPPSPTATKLVTDMLIERNVGADPLAATLDVQVTPSPLRITAPPAPTATNRRLGAVGTLMLPVIATTAYKSVE